MLNTANILPFPVMPNKTWVKSFVYRENEVINRLMNVARSARVAEGLSHLHFVECIFRYWTASAPSAWLGINAPAFAVVVAIL